MNAFGCLLAAAGASKITEKKKKKLEKTAFGATGTIEKSRKTFEDTELGAALNAFSISK